MEQRYILLVTRRLTLKRNERSGKMQRQIIENRKHVIRNRKLRIYVQNTQI